MVRIENRQNIYHGSPSWETSLANKDLLQDFTIPNMNSVASKTAWRFEFYVKTDCTVSINGSSPIFLSSGDELELFDIWSFKILESDVVYRYIAFL